MIVYRAEPKYIDVLWPHAEPLLEKAIRRTIGEVGLEDVKGWLKTDRQQLWLILDEEEQEIIVAFTTEIYVYPNHKHLRGHLWGAKRNTMNYQPNGTGRKTVRIRSRGSAKCSFAPRRASNRQRGSWAMQGGDEPNFLQ